MQVDQIKFVTGQFEPFVACKTFALGTSGASIAEGSEIRFDGTTVIVDESRYVYPNLRGAIKLGWLVPKSQYGSSVASAPVSANIGVRPAVSTQQNAFQPVKKSVSVTVESDEKVVLEQGQRTASVRNQAKSHTGSVNPTGQDGVVVGRGFKTSARTESTLTPDTVGKAFSDVDRVRIDPGRGLSEAEYLARLSDEQREAYLSEKESRVASHLEGLSEDEKKRYLSSKRVVEEASPQVVGQIKTAKVVNADGFQATLTTGRGTEIADFSGSTKPSVSTVDVSEGITFHNTNVQRKTSDAEVVESKIEKDGTAEARRRIAKALCADFPDEYDFGDHWKRRLARIQLHYVDRPDVVRAIFAAESDDFKKVLLEEFPEAFAA